MFAPYVYKRSIKIEGERSSTLHQMRGRIMMICVAFTILYSLVGIRMIDVGFIRVQGEEAERFINVAQNASSKAAKAEPVLPNTRRGNIYDRNGVLLASSIKVPSLYADPRYIENPAQTARDLIQIFPELDYADVYEKLASKRRFVWIKRNITPSENTDILKLGQPGLKFQTQDVRFYPQEGLAAHILGFTNVDNKGLAGVEREFNKVLERGENITISIDSRLQSIVLRAVQDAMNDFSAKGGVGIVMDTQSGEILAGVSLPSFNPNRAASSKAEERFNKLSLGVYELGSVFKIFSTAAFIDKLDPDASQSFDVRKPLEVGRFKIRDFHPENRIMKLPEVFMHSSNIGSALMGQALGTERLRGFYEELGLLTPMTENMMELGKPLVPEPWREINTLTATYGHGIATTPLQVAAATASVVNGGFSVTPRLLIKEDQDLIQTRVISEKTSQLMQSIMVQAVEEGTGSKVKIEGYRVGGKTGTAEKNEGGRYVNDKKLSSFVATFPGYDPRFVVFVMVDEPQPNERSFGYATGGWVAAPAAREIIKGIAGLYTIPPASKEGAGKQTSTMGREGVKYAANRY